MIEPCAVFLASSFASLNFCYLDVRSHLDVLFFLYNLNNLCPFQSAELGSWRATKPSTTKLEPSGLDESTVSWTRAKTA